jgi:hypothetical protein
MTLKQRDAFTGRCLMILETARADRDSCPEATSL